jgi:lysyl-tRNA synthetase class 2
MDWRPNADIETLEVRARLLADIRSFFAALGVMEVDTPLLSAAGATDPQLQSLAVSDAGYLITSPEFAMKRLLAAGGEPIYQLGHVFRAGERGRWHNPEFCMLEWYRPGWPVARLIGELADLLTSLGAPTPAQATYGELFREALGLDPHEAGVDALRARAEGLELAPTNAPGDDGEARRGFWLDLLMGAHVGPRLGGDAPVVVTDFPVCQAELTRVRAGEPPVAERFELYWRGVELANGGDELTDVGELRRRFVADLSIRRQEGGTPPPVDERLAAALMHGLPACSGVAVGVDRLLALLLGFDCLDAVLPFAHDRA